MKSSTSILLANGIFMFATLTGCETYIPSWSTPLFLPNKNSCMVQKLCTSFYGYDGCVEKSAYAIPVFETKERCEFAFKGKIACELIQDGEPSEQVCEKKIETIIDEEDNEGTVETFDCKEAKSAVAKNSYFGPKDRKAVEQWFKGDEKLPINSLVPPFKGVFNPGTEVGYFLPDGEKADVTSEKIKNAQVACKLLIPEAPSSARLTDAPAIAPSNSSGFWLGYFLGGGFRPSIIQSPGYFAQPSPKFYGYNGTSRYSIPQKTAAEGIANRSVINSGTRSSSGKVSVPAKAVRGGFGSFGRSSAGG